MDISHTPPRGHERFRLGGKNPQTPEQPSRRREQPPTSPRSARRYRRRSILSENHAPLAQRQDPDNFTELQRKATHEKGLRLYKMKRQKKRELWQFVRLIAKEGLEDIPDDKLTNGHAKGAYCLKCGISLDFKTGKHGVKQHMEIHHPKSLESFATMKKRGEQQEDNVTRNLSKDFADAADSNQLLVVTQKQQKHANRLLAKWVACHFRPIMIVEDAGFVEFVRFITEDISHVKLKLPKRTQLRHEIVALAADLRRKVQEDIARCCKYFSITTDIWSARDARSYISLTIHYLDEDFYPKSWTLEVIELPGIHDGEAIADALSNMMKTWSLVKDFCTRMLSDSGRNVVKAARLLHLEHMSCIAHTLHLVVSGAMIKSKASAGDIPKWIADVEGESDVPILEHEEDEALSGEDQQEMEGLRAFAIEDLDCYLDKTIKALGENEMDAMRVIVQHFRSLAVYFRKSPKGRNRLQEIQISERGVKSNEAVNLQVDCPTRWSSCLLMLQRLIYLVGTLVSFFTHLKSTEGRKEFKDMESKLRRPKASDWMAIKCLTTLLDPFAKATETLGGQTYPTITLVLPVLSAIRKWLSRNDLFDSLKAIAGDESYVDETIFMMNKCRKIMLDLLDDRFSCLEDSDLVWISLLDPRIARSMSHLSIAAIPSACDALVRAAVELADDDWEPRPASNQHSYASRNTARSLNVSGINWQTNLFGSDEVEQLSSDLDHNCNEEVKLYLADVKKSVRVTTDSFEWWRIHKNVYPNLSRLARKWLGTVATSVPSERAFSTSGNIVTIKRGSLTPTMVRDLVFVSENWRRANE